MSLATMMAGKFDFGWGAGTSRVLGMEWVGCGGGGQKVNDGMILKGKRRIFRTGESGFIWEVNGDQMGQLPEGGKEKRESGGCHGFVSDCH